MRVVLSIANEDGSFDFLGELISAPPQIFAASSTCIFESDKEQIEDVVKAMCTKDHRVGIGSHTGRLSYIRPITGNPLSYGRLGEDDDK